LSWVETSPGAFASAMSSSDTRLLSWYVRHYVVSKKRKPTKREPSNAQSSCHRLHHIVPGKTISSLVLYEIEEQVTYIRCPLSAEGPAKRAVLIHNAAQHENDDLESI
jgi:hypothetical protein